MSCQSNLAKLRDLSLFVDDATNLRPDIRAPYVGSASFAHKGGVHADAASKALAAHTSGAAATTLWAASSAACAAALH